MQDNIIIGKNSVYQYLDTNPKSIEKVLINKNYNQANDIIQLCKLKKIPFRIIKKGELPKGLRKYENKGVFAYIVNQNILSLEDILMKYQNKEARLMVLFDRITDIGNAGAIIRSGTAFGIKDFIFEQNQTASISAVLSKTSSGYCSLANIYRISSPSNLVNNLKDLGVYIISADMDGISIKEARPDYPALLIIGGEEKGIRNTLLKSSNTIISIPMERSVESLNVSAAASIIFYELYNE